MSNLASTPSSDDSVAIAAVLSQTAALCSTSAAPKDCLLRLVYIYYSGGPDACTVLYFSSKSNLWWIVLELKAKRIKEIIRWKLLLSEEEEWNSVVCNVSFYATSSKLCEDEEESPNDSRFLDKSLQQGIPSAFYPSFGGLLLLLPGAIHGN